jgi:hypothetical protein
MSSKPLSFHDLPTEVRNLIYCYAVTCKDEEVWPEKQNRLTCRLDISHAATFLLVSKIINAEATPIFYRKNQFCFQKVSPATTFILTIGKRNASHIKMLNLGSMSYNETEAQKIACCEKTALKNTARNLGRLCTGLELLDFAPEESPSLLREYVTQSYASYAPIACWTDNACTAVKALTIAFPWLSYVSYEERGDGADVRMTSTQALHDGGEVRSAVHNLGIKANRSTQYIPFDIDEVIRAPLV